MVATKQHFETVAKILRESGPVLAAELGDKAANHALNFIAQEFAGAFVESNPRFDRARFLKACGCGELA